MDDALRALLEDLIDYAGLFPPAALDMEPALENYLRYGAGGDAWMLGRFIAPAARADELRAAREHLGAAGSAPIALSAIVAPGAPLAADALGERVETLELRVPDGAAGDAAAQWLAGFAGSLAGSHLASQAVFLELDWSAHEHLPELLGAIGAAGGLAARLKLRCGGLEAAAFPASEPLARAVIACRDAGVPFKATAGLHHPLPRFDAGTGARMHGFLNLFGGAALARVHTLDWATVTAILEDDDPASFRFAEGVFTWRELSASAAELRRCRRELALSFGSCSFDEPREDLAALGLL